MEAAECLADIHSVPVKETDGLISPSNPLQAILDECNQMVQTYYESDLGEEKKKVQIRRLLELGQEKINEIRDYSGYRCCINTELNSGNFLMNGAGKDNYLVDWEKPLYGDPVQDLGHFLAPTTTFWKTDVILTEEEMADGKTFIAIALAVKALKNKEIRKIILSRPAVEAGEKLGFLPGEMKDKLDPYLQPLYDALQDMVPGAKLKEYMENNVIQIAPLAFMRGRTLNDAVIILDEAQNTTTHQIKMFLTRLGMNAKMIITGDVTQIDLPPTATSGLVQAMQILKGVKGIGKVEFEKKDIVRHKLVQRIVEAYDKFDSRQPRKSGSRTAPADTTNNINNSQDAP